MTYTVSSGTLNPSIPYLYFTSWDHKLIRKEQQEKKNRKKIKNSTKPTEEKREKSEKDSTYTFTHNICAYNI